MIIRAVLTAIALYFVTSSSYAGIVYQWRALNNEVPRGIQFEMEFDRATVASGAFSWSLEPGNYDGPADSTLGLKRIRFAYPFYGHTTSDPQYSVVDFVPQIGLMHMQTQIHMSVTFNAEGYLEGMVFFSTINPDLSLAMISEGRLFTIGASGDGTGHTGAGCGWGIEIDCAGAVGEMRRVDVPEPESLALIGLGLLAVFAIRRKVTL